MTARSADTANGKDVKSRSGPVLLFGMPRSGTTWLGKVFDSHPDTLYRHEPDSGSALDGSMPLFPEASRATEYAQEATRFVEALPDNHSLRVTGKLPVFRKHGQSTMAWQLRRASLLAGKVASRWLAIESAPEFRHRSATTVLVWKSIESLGRIGVLARALPDSRAIHIIRHPCGYVASVLSGEASGLMPGTVAASEDYGILELLLATEGARRRRLSLEYFRSLHPVERLAWRWLLYNEKALADLQDQGNARLAVYEELCRDPAGGFCHLFEFAGLSWDPQTAAFVDASTHTENSAYFSVFKDPERAAHGWRQKLAVRDQEQVLAVVAESAPGLIFDRE